MTTLSIQPLGYALGAEVLGIDARRPLPAPILRTIYEAWLKHHLLVFPGQDLSPQEHIEFSRQFGELDPHANQPSRYLHPDHKEILLVTNRLVDGKPSETRRTGRNWHADLTYTRAPTKGALLLCKERPAVGGDTIWANTQLAYETLSSTFRALVDSLEALYLPAFGKHTQGRLQNEELAARNPPVIHPLVAVHPETGRKGLRVGQRISRIVGLAEEESAALLDFLNTHTTSPEFTYRHRWQRHDIVLWDNRSTLHLAVPDFDQTQHRTLLRCSLQGEVTGRLAEAEPAPDREATLQALAAVS